MVIDQRFQWKDYKIISETLTCMTMGVWKTALSTINLTLLFFGIHMIRRIRLSPLVLNSRTCPTGTGDMIKKNLMSVQ